MKLYLNKAVKDKCREEGRESAPQTTPALAKQTGSVVMPDSPIFFPVPLTFAAPISGTASCSSLSVRRRSDPLL